MKVNRAHEARLRWMSLQRESSTKVDVRCLGCSGSFDLETVCTLTWIHPRVIRSLSIWNSKSSSSFVVEQVSEVAVCFGMINVVTVSLFRDYIR